MQRLIDFVNVELELLGAVQSWRSRSAVLFFIALLAPLLMLMFFAPVLSQLAWPGLADAFRPVAGLVSLAFMLHLMVLAIRTYLRDRAQFLKF